MNIFFQFEFPHIKSMNILAVFMLETLTLSKTLKSSRDDFNVLDNVNVSSIKAAIFSHLLVVVRLAGRASLIVLVHLLMNVTLMVILVLSNVNKSSSSFHHQSSSSKLKTLMTFGDNFAKVCRLPSDQQSTSFCYSYGFARLCCHC